MVALTKADLAAARDAEVAAQVRALLPNTALASAPLLPVSAVTGEGIEALRGALPALGRASAMPSCILAWRSIARSR